MSVCVCGGGGGIGVEVDVGRRGPLALQKEGAAVKGVQ